MKKDPPLLNFFWNRQSISESDIIEGVKNGSFFGLLKADLTCPEPVKQKYLELNFAPVFNHVKVTEEMIHADFREFARNKFPKFPLDPQLTLTFNANGMIFSTPLLQYYLTNGFIVSNIQYAAEYVEEAPFRPFVNKLVDMRIEATDTNNNLQQNLSKMIMNSSWVCSIYFNLIEIFYFRAVYA